MAHECSFKEFAKVRVNIEKNRLTEVLETTKDVDFSAELVTRNNKKYFANPAYEKKSNNWKYAFRAGKETTTTVRGFIQAWLKELP